MPHVQSQSYNCLRLQPFLVCLLFSSVFPQPVPASLLDACQIGGLTSFFQTSICFLQPLFWWLITTVDMSSYWPRQYSVVTQFRPGCCGVVALCSQVYPEVDPIDPSNSCKNRISHRPNAGPNHMFHYVLSQLPSPLVSNRSNPRRYGEDDSSCIKVMPCKMLRKSPMGVKAACNSKSSYTSKPNTL